MWKILLGEFWADLRSQTTRAVLTSLAIAWGTFTIVLLLALGEGLKRRAINELLFAYEQSTTIGGGATSRPYQGLAPGRAIRLTEDDARAIRQRLTGIEALSPAYYRGNVVKAVDGNEVRVGRLEGVYPDYAQLRRIRPTAGSRFLNDRDQSGQRRVVFLGDSLAARLFADDDALGRSMYIDNQPFTVIGVQEPRLEADVDLLGSDFRALIPASTFVAMFGSTTVNEIILQAHESRSGDDLDQELRTLLGERHRFEPTDRRAVWIIDWGEQARTARQVLTGVQVFLGLIGGLTLFAAGVGVANIMFVAVHERTTEIGVKLAIGARRGHIMVQFVFEALVLALAGGLVGLAVGAGGVSLINTLPKEHEALTYLLNPVMSWTIGYATVAVLTLIGLTAGVFPARRAAALNPVVALRYE